MKNELTDEEKSHLCMYMRVIDLMGKNQNVLDENKEIKEKYDKLCLTVNQIMETISEEQQDEVLEMHKVQLQELANQEAKKQTKKQQKNKK